MFNIQRFIILEDSILTYFAKSAHLLRVCSSVRRLCAVCAYYTHIIYFSIYQFVI